MRLMECHEEREHVGPVEHAVTLQAAAAEKALAGEESVDVLLGVRRRQGGDGYVGSMLG